MSVQGFTADETLEETIVPIWCAACGSYHLMNVKEEQAKRKDK